MSHPTAGPTADCKTTDPILVTSLQAARLLAVSPRTLWSLTKEGRIPCVRLGHAKRYAVQDLLSAVSSLTEGGAK